ncbi:DUF5063 domain-containing protein [Granulosicoccus sp.]|nr:DUF5063 domain-containing protein [Granulosicoccus sp.]MDB4224887.1 DUF5063 domain-containing protein [Granulosicoccus sp.]
MNIDESTSRFLRFCLEDSECTPDHGELLIELDLLVVSANIGEFSYDEKDYPDAPEWDPAEIRERLCERFPKLGLYCTSYGELEKFEEAQIVVGDAIDDLVDIVLDLKDVQWCLKNTSTYDAAWNYQFRYRTHWGLHARELQLHLHKYWW